VGTIEADAPSGPTTASPAGWWRILSPIGATVAGLAMAIVTIGLLTPTSLSEEATGSIATVVGSASLLVFGLALWRGLPRHERRLALATKGRAASAVGIGVLAGLGTMVLAAPLFLVGEWLDPSVGRRLDDLADETQLSGIIWADLLVVVALVALAPLGEELLDRALLLRGLARVVSFLPAAVISSVVFSLSHLDAWILFLWPRAIWLVVAGLVFAWVYRERGYACAVAAHATVNGVAAIALVASS
jgi:membrane protease YdiL (CAAX protease family)